MAISDHVDLDQFMKGLKRRNLGETEFQQAVYEVASNVFDYIADKEIYHDAQILRRIAEPDRVVSFRVCWEDDNGNIRVQRGWRVQNNNAIGPYKGGLRFHPSVTQSILKFLAFEQTFKNSLTGLPMGGAKGGANFNPKGKSSREVMRFCQSFMNELYRHVGEDTDVPAGDIGVGAREIGYLFGQYKRLTNRFVGVLTGKGMEYGGSPIRTEATGYGTVYFMESMLGNVKDSVEGKRCLVTGSGNVAQYAVEKINQLGGKAITLSDSNGFIYDPNGIDEEKLAWVDGPQERPSRPPERVRQGVRLRAPRGPALGRRGGSRLPLRHAERDLDRGGAHSHQERDPRRLRGREHADRAGRDPCLHRGEDPLRTQQGRQRRRRSRLRPRDEPELRAHHLEGRGAPEAPCATS